MNIHTQVILSVLGLFTWQVTADGQQPDIQINELLASNQSQYRDPDTLEFSDWIELHNTTDRDLDLAGHFLTDDWDEPLKWLIPVGTVIPGGGYLLVWADGRDEALHTNFKLNRAGEYVGLYTGDRVLVDSVTFGAQQDNLSFGRLPYRDTQWGFYEQPTPGQANGAGHRIGTSPAPVFSLVGGFHSGHQALSFQNADQMDIYYSLDGTPPEDSALQYQGPIILDRTVAVRAIGYASQLAPSEVVTHTYFIDEKINLPFISLVTDPDNFFSDEKGIYVTGTRGRGGYCDSAIRNVKQDWERPVNIELYETAGDLAFNQRAGVKIFGGCSRHRFPQKSLALFARRGYGKGSFDYAIFPDKDINSFESFILRSSADDQVSTLFRDALSQTVLKAFMDVDIQAYRPAVVFLNGQYWGIHNIREKINEHYVAGNFGVDPDEVNLLQGNALVMTGANAGYTAMVDYANTHSMANNAHYAVLEAQMDMDQYMDYQIGHIFLAENDWPGNNIKFWRANTGFHAKWRWINYDMDGCFATWSASKNMIHKTTTATETTWPNPEWSTRLFRNLLDNDGFRNTFVQRYAYHMNTTFASERVLDIIDQMQAALAPEIVRHIDRWGGQKDPDALETWQSPTFNSVALWEQNVDGMRVFAIERSAFTKDHFIDHFGLSGMSSVRLNLNRAGSGVLKVNGKPLADGVQWDYFNDIPITAQATPLLGHTFSHWEVQSMGIALETIFPVGSVWKYSDTGEDLGAQWRQEDYDDTAWSSGPAQLGYGDQDEETVVAYGSERDNKHMTTYFRKSFELIDVSRLHSLSISLLADDGAVVYLNGQEIARHNMLAGTIDHHTPAPRPVRNEHTFVGFELSPEHLISGTNVLAVEVHQATPDSPDLSFDCALFAQADTAVESTPYDTPQVTITLTGDAQLMAHFERDPGMGSDPVVITEINFNSDPEADSGDWIELYNQSEAAIDVTGWQFVDDGGRAYTFPPDLIFWPNDRLVLCRDKIRFKTVYPHVPNLLGNFEFGLSGNGELLRILNADKEVVDHVDYASVAPWPVNQGSGHTIELKDPSMDNTLGQHWHAGPLYGTPGQ